MTKKINFKKIIIVVTIILFVVIIYFVINYLCRHVFYQKDYENIVKQASNKYDIDKFLIFSVIKTESNFNKNAISNKNARGLMQLMEATAKEIASKEANYASIENLNLHNPEINIDIGTKYLKDLIKKYDGNYLLAIAAYNRWNGKCR